MTALSLNLLPASKPLEVAGIPLDGLPALEAGRTVPQAFADVLSKAGIPVGQGGGEQAEEQAKTGEPPLPIGKRAPVADDPVTATKSGKPDQPVPVSEPEVAKPAAASGKALPDARPDIAALKSPACEPETVMKDGKRASVATAIGDKPEVVPVMDREPTAPKDPAKSGKPELVPVMDREPSAPADKPVETAAAHSVAPPAEVPVPVDAKVQTIVQANVAPVVAQQLLAPTTLPGVAASARPGAKTPGAETAAIQSGPRIATGSTDSQAAASLASTVRTAGTPAQTAHDMTGGDHARRGEPDAEPAARAAAARTADGSLQTPPAARGAPETPQTGLSLQVRAADRPIAAPEASQLAASTSGTAPQPTAGAPAAPLSAPLAPGVSFGTASQPAASPQFPDLAAMVDRIVAARDSAGSASATIAVAHKELGNLSLTFETSGRMLDVEVAAQDSDTQRALAAAIAADRPQLRGADTLANTQSQTHNQTQGQAQAQTGASAQGGDPGTRQSGEAGDGRADRQSGRGGSDRHDGGQPRGSAHRSADPKSDGGIYA